LGTAYNASTWVEKTAYQNADGVIAVSKSMKKDVHDLYDVPEDKIHVIYNGIDLDQYKPTPDEAVLREFGIDPCKPFILFVGRITRQKGIIHLVNAIPYIESGVQIVLCAGAPDTKEISMEMEEAVTKARAKSDNPIIWIAEMLPKDKVITLYSMASIFVCPSVYEPFGIINLEAMACETPVVASAVGGIREVVIPEETGLLVPIHARGETDFEPVEPDQFSQGLARAVNRLISHPEIMKSMAKKSRERVEKYFSWTSIARQTLDFYQELINQRK
jgi:starch synthase